MNRRKFLCGLTLGLLAVSLAAEAQETGKVYRIGAIASGRPDPGGEMIFRAFRERLQELGYSDGRNLILERRFAEGRLERLQQLAQDLAAINVDVMSHGARLPLRPQSELRQRHRSSWHRAEMLLPPASYNPSHVLEAT